MIEIKNQTGKNLYFSYEFKKSLCSVYQINAIITKYGFLNSTSKIIKIYDLIPMPDKMADVSSMTKIINQTTKHIILQFDLIDNIWKNCLNTVFRLEIYKELCDTDKTQLKIEPTPIPLTDVNTAIEFRIDLDNGD